MTTFDQRFSQLILHRSSGSFSISQVPYPEFEVDIADTSDFSEVTDNIREFPFVVHFEQVSAEQAKQNLKHGLTCVIRIDLSDE